LALRFDGAGLIFSREALEPRDRQVVADRICEAQALFGACAKKASILHGASPGLLFLSANLDEQIAAQLPL
jgi:hypothetical protein